MSGALDITCNEDGGVAFDASDLSPLQEALRNNEVNFGGHAPPHVKQAISESQALLAGLNLPIIKQAGGSDLDMTRALSLLVRHMFTAKHKFETQEGYGLSPDVIAIAREAAAIVELFAQKGVPLTEELLIKAVLFYDLAFWQTFFQSAEYDWAAELSPFELKWVLRKHSRDFLPHIKAAQAKVDEIMKDPEHSWLSGSRRFLKRMVLRSPGAECELPQNDKPNDINDLRAAVRARYVKLSGVPGDDNEEQLAKLERALENSSAAKIEQLIGVELGMVSTFRTFFRRLLIAKNRFQQAALCETKLDLVSLEREAMDVIALFAKMKAPLNDDLLAKIMLYHGIEPWRAFFESDGYEWMGNSPSEIKRFLRDNPKVIFKRIDASEKAYATIMACPKCAWLHDSKSLVRHLALRNADTAHDTVLNLHKEYESIRAGEKHTWISGRTDLIKEVLIGSPNNFDAKLEDSEKIFNTIMGDAKYAWLHNSPRLVAETAINRRDSYERHLEAAKASFDSIMNDSDYAWIHKTTSFVKKVAVERGAGAIQYIADSSVIIEEILGADEFDWGPKPVGLILQLVNANRLNLADLISIHKIWRNVLDSDKLKNFHSYPRMLMSVVARHKENTPAYLISINERIAEIENDENQQWLHGDTELLRWVMLKNGVLNEQTLTNAKVAFEDIMNTPSLKEFHGSTHLVKKCILNSPASAKKVLLSALSSTDEILQDAEFAWLQNWPGTIREMCVSYGSNIVDRLRKAKTEYENIMADDRCSFMRASTTTVIKFVLARVAAHEFLLESNGAFNLATKMSEKTISLKRRVAQLKERLEGKSKSIRARARVEREMKVCRQMHDLNLSDLPEQRVETLRRVHAHAIVSGINTAPQYYLANHRHIYGKATERMDYLVEKFGSGPVQKAFERNACLFKDSLKHVTSVIGYLEGRGFDAEGLQRVLSSNPAFINFSLKHTQAAYEAVLRWHLGDEKKATASLVGNPSLLTSTPAYITKIYTLLVRECGNDIELALSIIGDYPLVLANVSNLKALFALLSQKHGSKSLLVAKACPMLFKHTPQYLEQIYECLEEKATGMNATKLAEEFPVILSLRLGEIRKYDISTILRKAMDKAESFSGFQERSIVVGQTERMDAVGMDFYDRGAHEAFFNEDYLT